jgi:cysteine desulfuration protein SufE
MDSAHQDAMLAALSALRDPQARLAWAVEQAKRRAPLPDVLRTDTHRVEGCLVRLWFVPEFRDGRCWFQSDSDAVTLKAMVGLLCEWSDGATPEEILTRGSAPLDRLGLLRQLAENRRATVLRVAGQIRDFATAHL